VPFPDVVALAGSVERVVSSRDLRAALVLRALRRWRVRQSPQVVVPRFGRLLADLCLPAGSASPREELPWA
jgi:hypothetical protein